MKTLLLVLLVFFTTIVSAVEYQGTFLNLSHVTTYFYKVDVSVNGTTQTGYLYNHPSLPGHMAEYNLIKLVDDSPYQCQIKIVVEGYYIQEVQVFSLDWDDEFAQIQQIAGIQIGRLAMGGNGVLVVKAADNGAFNYRVNGSTTWPWVVYNAHGTSLNGYLAMKHLFDGDRGIHNVVTIFQIHSHGTYHQATPIQ